MARGVFRYAGDAPVKVISISEGEGVGIRHRVKGIRLKERGRNPRWRLEERPKYFRDLRLEAKNLFLPQTLCPKPVASVVSSLDFWFVNPPIPKNEAAGFVPLLQARPRIRMRASTLQ